MAATSLCSQPFAMEPVLEVQRVVVVDDEPPVRAVRRALDVLERSPNCAVVIHTAFGDDRIALAGLVAGAAAVVPKSGLGNELTNAVRAAARRGSVRPRITIDALVEAAGMVDSDDIPILSMLVHGTSPAGIGEAIGVHERELAGRRRRMLNALLGDSPS
jgi:DNA-binding NarL/FixJ family response regulator